MEKEESGRGNGPSEDRNSEEFQRVATRVSLVSILGNTLLTIFKFAAGILADSGAMISDAVHSASDVASSFIVIIGVRISGRSPDKDHPYGHERFECVAALLLAMLLAVVGGEIGISAVKSIMNGTEEMGIPGTLALVAAIISIAVKEWMYHYTRRAAIKINSTVLMADAWHHRSDALSSIGALIGIAGARMGYPVMDPAVSILISGMVLKVVFDITKTAVGQLIDESASPEVTEEIRCIAENTPGVLRIDDLKTRLHGSRLFVDIEIAAEGSLSLTEAHQIAETVHLAVEQGIPNVKHCMVHVNPSEEM